MILLEFFLTSCLIKYVFWNSNKSNRLQHDIFSYVMQMQNGGIQMFNRRSTFLKHIAWHGAHAAKRVAFVVTGARVVALHKLFNGENIAELFKTNDSVCVCVGALCIAIKYSTV